MKFFKYLIFLFLSLISISAFADYKTRQYSEPQKPIFIGDQIFPTAAATCSAFKAIYTKATNCGKDGDPILQMFIDGNPIAIGDYKKPQGCTPGVKRWLEGYITDQNSSFPAEVCFASCIHKTTDGSAFTTPNNNLEWGFYAETTGVSCQVDTPKGEDKPVPTDPNMKPEECKNATGSDAYCDKPADKNCPTGYKQGMFNNKQICVKNSTDPDPTKPNPNDPNNGDGDGNCNGTNNCNTTNFDDSKIIEAINASTSAITNAISSLSSTITNGFNALASSINSITGSINANTNAVNANGDKVTNAVNAGTNATKENGKKLDGIKDAVGEGNGLIKNIKDWLTGEPVLENGQLEVKDEILPGYERKDYVQFINTCPFTSEEVSLPMGVLPPITFTKDLTFICSYGLDARPYIIGLGYLGALIYLLYGLRSRNG